jgi:hypothetical protein
MPSLTPQRVAVGTSGANAAQTITVAPFDDEVVSADANTGVVAGVFNNGASPWVTTPAVGDRIYVRGFANAVNNGIHRVTASDADTITVATTLTNEAAPGSVDIDTMLKRTLHVYAYHAHTQDGLGAMIPEVSLVQNGSTVTFKHRMGTSAEITASNLDLVGDTWGFLTLVVPAAGVGKISEAWIVYSYEEG